MHEIVRAIVADILGMDEGSVDADLSAETADNWDSMNHLRIVSALEQECRVAFTMDEIQVATSIGALTELVERKRRAA